ncbi:short-chain dehydrogenase/reductase [Sporothrix schenckii 1099-18]|uniref:Short-chain dehydrogenase/reductase n=1 Tax=Sporothrix schenckii 1099-18 TaxID=1397361 RepID=A0A0F2LXG6_SPOSC|nr:short-chain dehydrogenase/reductase [Sporothrix schenckii 1099-18]KJR82157.1 short-chain dehydrogenase/reductase [Sporothrix schenckii 1099-18]
MVAQKSVLITGCSLGGIGDALAREFHKRGLQVFATARNTAKMTELEALGITTLEMDVTSPESIKAAVAHVATASGGRLDILVNNAGLNHVMPFADCDLADVKRVLDTNIFGVFAVTHALLPQLRAAGGVVANISSINTVLHPPYQTAYNASKAAINTLGDTLRVELAPLGVRVVTIITGSVASHLFDNADERCHLPEGSVYAPLKERIEKKDFLDGIHWTPANDYARQVASDLLRTSPQPVLWRATFATMAWILNTFGWTGMLDSPMSKRVGLDKLKPPVVQ